MPSAMIFPEFLSFYTENWLLWFSLIFVGFAVFSPNGLIGAASGAGRYRIRDGEPFHPQRAGGTPVNN
jgi:hypothetical protein